MTTQVYVYDGKNITGSITKKSYDSSTGILTCLVSNDFYTTVVAYVP